MNIGFDAKRAAQNATGLGNYSRFIIRSLEVIHPEQTYFLYTPDIRKTRFLPPSAVRTPQGGWRHFPSLWRSGGMTSDLIRDRIDLFHGLSNELPFTIRKASRTKSVVTIHDLIFLHLPYCYPLIDRLIYNYKFRKACQNADRVIAVSECTRRDIIRFYHIPAEKIDVVYQGCDPAFREPISEATLLDVAQRYRLPERFILYVGSIERRKNLLLLAEALRHLDSSYQVIAVGKKTPYADQVLHFLQTNGLTDRLRMIHDVPFADLPSFYRLAHTFVYPSRYEGFGIPMLEALCSGTPAIGATGSCLEEAGGPHSLYVHPDDAEGLAQAIRQTYEDTSLRDEMRSHGYTYAERFLPERLTQDLWEVYEKTLR